MSTPYRDADGVVAVEAGADANAVVPLATFDVSGKDGEDGRHGVAGPAGMSSGQDGGRGGDATAAMRGENAGMIRIELAADKDDATVALRGEYVTARGVREAIRNAVVIDERGFIPLLATGGKGGRGGNGGRGGDGARGHDGSDATRWSSGSDGGNGGDGGDGGNATSGAPGGDGGNIIVSVSDDDTPLLMLLDHAIDGGRGGKPGMNGGGGMGGSGGSGGSSYSWTTTSTHRDSNGNSHTTTHYHSNPGGSSGSSGSSGRTGRAPVVAGANGEDGTFQINVATDGGVKTYPSRYDLRLVGFSHESLNEDAVYEPRELVRVFDLEVENVGGMPTPAKDELKLALRAGGWVHPEPGELQCVRSLEPGGRYKVPGELRFRIGDHTPEGPSEPLEVEESILQRAMLPSVRRDFRDYQQHEALEAGRFVIRYPARLSTVTNLRSLCAGEASRVRFSVTNQSRFALGAKSASKRVLRVRVTSAPESEIDDDKATFIADGGELPPSTGWTHELDVLEAGETANLEFTVKIKDGAPEYLRFAALVTLDLGDLEAPASPRAIQQRGFDVRVARPFQVSDADLLLVVNHRTTREEIAAWEGLAERLSFKVAIWDLSRERHLDLEAPLSDGVALASWFERKAIVVLDNEIDGPDGPVHPHVFLADEQATRAAVTGIDIAFVGKGPHLQRIMIPAPDAAKPAETTTLYRRYWFRWWAQPTTDWLEKQAHAISAKLCEGAPEQRHVVVHRFAPEVESKLLWIKRWRVGTVEHVRTLDAAAGALVHAAADDARLHDPAYAASTEAQTALLVMFDFDENLERLRRMSLWPDVTQAALDAVTDALFLDLANELAAILAPGWREGADMAHALPRLEALGRSKIVAEYGTLPASALLRLASRLLFLADSQVSWWEALPPWRWWRRGPSARSVVGTHVDHFLAGAFGTHNLNQVRADALVLADQLDAQHRTARKTNFVGKQRLWALELARAPLAIKGITSDTEVLATPEERVMAGTAYEEIMVAKQADAAQRAALVASAEAQHADLRA